MEEEELCSAHLCITVKHPRDSWNSASAGHPMLETHVL